MKTLIIKFIVVAVLASSTVVARQTDSAKSKEPPLPKPATELTSINFKDADLRDVFRALSYQHRLNIFVENSIALRVTISLSRVRVIDAIRFLCEQNGLLLNVEGDIFKVISPPRPEPPLKIPMVYFENRLLTVKLKNDDLELVILEIQKKSEKNILVTPGTAGFVSGTLNDIDFEIGFTQLMNNNGFALQKRNGIYIVSRLDYFVGQQAASPQRIGPYWISVKDSLVTLDVTNAPIERVITDMVRQLNADVVFYNAVSGSVTARASNVSLAKALDVILRNTNFSYRETEGIYFIGEKSNKALIATKLLKLKYLRAEKVLDVVPQSIASQAAIKVMKEHNGVVMVAPNDVIAQAEELFRQIDKPVAQVLIEAIVVDFDRLRSFDLGVSAGYRGAADTLSSKRTETLVPGIDLSFSPTDLTRALQGVVNVGRLPSNFYLNLRALEQKGIANIRSRPLLATLNGHAATLSIGTTQYFILKTTTPYRDPTQVVFQESQTFHTIEADVKLEITPYVGADGQITVEIKPDFRTPVGALSPNIPPTINKRAMSSTILMREGETIVLGGLIQETESETRTQTPILGSIPLLGYLFSSTTMQRNKSELIIYVTPHISYGEAFQNVHIQSEEK